MSLRKSFSKRFASRRTPIHYGRSAAKPFKKTGLFVERLEDRTVPAGVSLQGVLPTWLPEGPAPNSGGNAQGTNMTSETGVANNPEDTGAIQAIAVNPGDSKNVFVGAVNGGIWETTDITANPVAWVPLTDQFPSLEISSIQFDPTDGAHKTLVAGIGNTSNEFANFGPMTGLLRSTDDGKTWTELGDAPLAAKGLQGEIVSAVLPRGNTILVAVSSSSPGFNVISTSAGLFRSTDGGQTFQPISGLNKLGNGQVFDMAGDPSNSNRAYVAVGGPSGGVFRTDDLGSTWTPVSSAAITTQLASAINAKLAVSAAAANPVYLATASNSELSGVFRSPDLGVTWTAMDLPQTLDAKRSITGTSAGSPIVVTISAGVTYTTRVAERVRISGAADPAANGDWTITPIDSTHFSLNGSTGTVGGGGAGGTAQVIQGINNGGQASSNLALAADPGNSNLVYIAGDAEQFPDRSQTNRTPTDSSLGANDFTARIFRGDASVAAQGAGAVITDATHQWSALVNSGNATKSAPHADARALVFSGTQLLYGCDGGINEETSPTDATGKWVSKNGGPNGKNNALQITQFASAISYDSNSDIIFGGAQDTGTPQQRAPQSQDYVDQTGGDGVFTAVDDLTTPGGNSHRYIGFTRVDYSNANANLGTGINLIPTAGVSGFNNFIGLVVSNVAPAAGNSTRVVIFNGGTAGSGTALFQSDNAGTATTTAGVTWTQVTTGAGWGGVNVFNGSGNGNAGVFALAVGGNLNGAANQDVIYAGSGNQVFLRSAATGTGATLAATAAQPLVSPGVPAGTIQSIAIDPNNWMTAYVSDGSHVFQTTNGGTSWTNITGQLTDTNIDYILAVDGTGTNAGLSAVLVGETNGVFRMLSSAPTVWTKYGPDFPNSVVRGLQYSPNNGGTLVAGTSGRGAFEVQKADASLFSPTTLLICGDQDFTNENDTFRLVRDKNNSAMLDVFVNGVMSGPYGLAAIQTIVIYGGGGNNTLIVDSSNGLINVPQGIDWNAADACPGMTTAGQDGFNQTILTQAAGANAPTLTTDVYSVGPTPGNGMSVVTDSNGNVQTVNFFEVSPTFDSLPATALTVNATNASNAINYAEGKNSPADFNANPPVFDANWGEVSVDNQEPIEFTNKDHLVINGLAGSDIINLNNPNVPAGSNGTTDPGLLDITVNGNDPTGTGAAGDTLVANDTFNTENINFQPNGADRGSISNAGPVPITFASVEQVQINGQGGDDTLTVTTPIDGETVTVTPGPTVDSGSVQVASLVPLSFINLGAGGMLAIANGGGGNSDTLVYNGTPAADTFTVSATTILGFAAELITLNNQIPVNAPGADVSTLRLNGLSGDDTFGLTGPLPYTSTLIDGGEPSASDIVDLTGATGPVTVNLGDSSVPTNTAIDGYGGTVTLIGVEVANLDTGGNPLTVNGTARNDTITYTPTGAQAGTFQNAGLNTVFNFTNVSDTFTINGNGGNADQVVVNGTAGRDLFAIRADNRTVTVTDASGTALQPVTLGNDVQVLTANGGGGRDTFQVTPAAGLQFPPDNLDNLLINVNGSATGANSALVIQSATGGALDANQFVVVNRGAAPNSGTVRVYTGGTQWPDINYANVQVVSPKVAGTNLNPNLLVMGPDLYEPNETQGTATFLGAGSTLQIQHASIFPNGNEFPGVPADQDYYQVVAQTTGTLDFQVYFRTFDPALLPGGGQINLQVLDAAGNVIASAPGTFGADAGTGNARVRIPAVAGQSYFLHVFGADATVVNGYNATIIDTAPPTPFDLELSRSVPNGEPAGTPNDPNNVAGAPDTGDLPPDAAADDTGRSQFDNVTRVNTPTIYLRLSDAILLNDLPGNGAPNTPPAGVIPIPFSPDAATPGFRVAVFDGNDTQNPVGFATQVAGFPGLYQFTFPNALPDGLHHITAAVQMVDPATPTETGFGPVSTSLAITVDTAAPPVVFGTGANGNNGLDAGSDSGVVATPDTLADDVTNVTNPTFYGAAEANSIVRVYATANAGAMSGQLILIGQTVATPIDGTNAFPNGRWSVQSNVSLNDPRFFTKDGTRTITVTAEDLAGNVTDAEEPPTMHVFVDTAGPNVTNVFISDPTTGARVLGTNGLPFDLFALKPTNFNQGPTPLVHSITISLADLPARDATFFANYLALDPNADINPGLFTLVGDQVGNIPIKQVILTNDPVLDGQPATATIQLLFADQLPGDNSALPDDRYTLTVNDGVVDPAGNKLDGESSASTPPGAAPFFPSGNGVPGGNFVARFTVDSRPHIGITNDGQELDINGNGIWDPVNAKDAVNSDKAFRFATISDTVFAGNFAPTGASGTGFNELGAYGRVNGVFRWVLTFHGVAAPEYQVISGLQINGLPVAFHFNPNIKADEIALFDGHGNWYIDYNHTNNIAPGALVISDGLRGYPVAGDFDGDGNFDLATYQPDTNTWQFDLDPLTAHRAFTAIHWGVPGVLERPVAADMNQDGVTDIGLFVPTSLNRAINPGANWYFLVSDTTATPPITGTVNTLNHQFNPTPFSHDLHYYFGNGFFEPVVGIWDPPAPSAPAPVRLAGGTFADVSVTAGVGAVPVGGKAGLVARGGASGQNEYWAGLAHTAKGYQAQIARVVNGSWQVLAAAPVVPAAYNTLRFDAVGTSLSLYVGGQPVVSAADATLRGAGGAGTYASYGSVVWPAQATAVTRAPAALPFADGFGQDNGSLLGTGWDQWSGTLRAQGGSAVGQQATDVATLHGAGAADVTVSADVTALPAGGFAGLLGRYNVATGDTYRAGLAAVVDPRSKAVTYAAQLWRRQSGKWTLLAAQPVGAGTGHLTFVTVSASEELFFNGTLVVVANDGTLKTGTAGLYATQGAGLANFAAARATFTTTGLPFADNFGSGSVPGLNWYSNQGGFGVSHGALVGLAGGNAMTLYGVSQQNVSVQARVVSLPAGASAGLLARYNAVTGNTYWAGIVSTYDPRTRKTTYSAQIRRRVNGVWTTVFSTGSGVHPGLLRFDVSGSQLSLSLDGTLLGTARDGTLSGAGTVGVTGDQGSQLGSFSAH